jgi:hypothetical protein
MKKKALDLSKEDASLLSIPHAFQTRDIAHCGTVSGDVITRMHNVARNTVLLRIVHTWLRTQVFKWFGKEVRKPEIYMIE